jgi:20S proteasome subunit alpha 6
MGGIDDSPSHLATEGLLDEHVPSHEDEDGTPPGLSGLSGPSVGLHPEGDHDLSLSSAAPEGVDGSFAASVEHSAHPDSSAASDNVVEHVVSTTEAAVDADKTHSTQTQVSAEPFPPAGTETTPATQDTEELEVTSQLARHTSSAQAEPNDCTDVVEETQLLMDSEPDHPPSPSTSTATLVLPSVPETPAQSESNSAGVEPSKAESARVPSANRLSISYAGATRRLVIDAGVVEKLKVLRHDARIEVHMKIDKAKDGQYKGILVRKFLQL